MIGGERKMIGGAPQMKRGASLFKWGAPQMIGGAPPMKRGAPPAVGGAPQTKWGAPQMTGGAPPIVLGDGKIIGGAPLFIGGDGKTAGDAPLFKSAKADLTSAPPPAETRHAEAAGWWRAFPNASLKTAGSNLPPLRLGAKIISSARRGSGCRTEIPRTAAAAVSARAPAARPASWTPRRQ